MPDADDVYDEEKREEAVEDGEMSPEEAGFMQGYEDSQEEQEKKKEKEEEEKEEKEEA